MRYALADDTGLGITGSQEVAIGSTAVNTGAGVALAHFIAIGAISGPVGAAIGAGVAVITMLISSLFKPNLDKIQASNDANQIEDLLKQNLANWLSIPANQRYATVQAAALNNFDVAWAKYLQLVQPLLKKAPNSISDRQQGSCAYHVAQPYGWIAGNYVRAGSNQRTGNCWNWFTGYRDPIASDPYVIPDPILTGNASLSGSLSSVVGTSLGSWFMWLGVGLLAGGLYYASSN